jgi:tetratricopeptide (TPR) repeat protein
MVEAQRPTGVATYNERSLKALDRALALSQGEFSLVLVHCNYKRLRDRILHQLRELSAHRYEIRELELPSSVTTLYTTIQTYRHVEDVRKEDAGTRDTHDGGKQEDMGTHRNGDTEISGLRPASTEGAAALTLSTNRWASFNKPHPALSVSGLESVAALDDLLASTNQVRDEFRKRLPFPIVVWVNDEVLQKLLHFAPDFASWAATPIKFEISTHELIDFLRQKANSLFKTVLSGGTGRYAPWRVCTHHSTLNLATGCRSRSELDSALRDLQSRGQAIELELDASLQFVFGQYDYASDYIDSAIAHYQQSLWFWRAINNLERQGIVLFYLGLCYCRLADLHRPQRRRYWEEAWPYLQQCVEVFTKAGRQDLVAQFITQLVEVLQRLQAWDTLLVGVQKSITLHQTYGSGVQLAQDYGFLAEVALQQFRWEDASEYARQALTLLKEAAGKPSEHQGLHRYLLAQLYQLFLVKSQRQSGNLSEAQQELELASLELQQAIASSEHRFEPQRYLHLLEELRELYFEQGQYLEAFRIKQEQRSVEQLYGLRAFIGAARLQPQRPITNPTLTPIEQQEIVAQEIAGC